MKVAISVLAGMFLFVGIPPKTVQARIPAADVGLQQTEQKAETFTGIVQKVAGDFVLSVSAGKIAYTLDNPEQAGMYEGKKVEVVGTMDATTNIIHVENIREVA